MNNECKIKKTISAWIKIKVTKLLPTEYAKADAIESIHITTPLKKTEVGNPDFRIWDGKQHIVRYIEAKDPSVDLDKALDIEQSKHYLDIFLYPFSMYLLQFGK